MEVIYPSAGKRKEAPWGDQQEKVNIRRGLVSMTSHSKWAGSRGRGLVVGRRTCQQSHILGFQRRIVSSKG